MESIIFLSAQPDKTYFIWQLELQLRNLNSLGIDKSKIQVLVSYSTDVGLNADFEIFMSESKNLAEFYCYPDKRQNPQYTSSVRANILKQHFELYPDLENETVFYHDSDILFSRIPAIKNVKKTAINYVSDTRNYLDIDYVRSVSDEELLQDMAAIVGVSVDTIEQNKSHTGGAQYILKGVNASFWEKVEKDSEALYICMKAYNRQLWINQYPHKKEYRSKKRGIQAWCADMWAVLWNLWYHNKPVEIHPELDFSWPFSSIDEWNRKAIQHYSGNIEEKEQFFKKSEYLNYMPWYDSGLSSIPATNCSYKIVELIKKRKEELDQERSQYINSCIVLDTRTYTHDQINNFAVVCSYIHKYIDVNIYMITDDGQDDDVIRQMDTMEWDKLIHDSTIETILYVSLPYIIDSQDWLKMLSPMYNQGDTDFFFEQVYSVDQLFTETFSKILDTDLLHSNQGKFNTRELGEDKSIRRVVLNSILADRKQQLDALYQGEDTSIEHRIPFPVSYILI